MTHISCRQGSAGSRALACAVCIASAHARRSCQRYQCNYPASSGADVDTAIHRPQQQLISSGKSPNGTFFLKRTILWTFTGLLHAWHLRLRRPPQQALRPLKHCHTGAQLSRAILEFILSVADRRATWLQVAQRYLL